MARAGAATALECIVVRPGRSGHRSESEGMPVRDGAFGSFEALRAGVRSRLGGIARY